MSGGTTRGSRHSRDCDKPSGRLGRQAGRAPDSSVLIEGGEKTLTPRTEEEEEKAGGQGAGNRSSRRWYEAPRYKSPCLHLSLSFHSASIVSQARQRSARRARSHVCLLRLKRPCLEVCTDTTAIGRDDEERVEETPQRAHGDTRH